MFPISNLFILLALKSLLITPKENGYLELNKNYNKIKLSKRQNYTTNIIVVTPTYKRLGRMADMISLANTLSHVEALHWLIIEDQDQISDSLDIFLEDTNIEYTYLGHKTPDGYPKKGWYQRDMAVKYIYLNHKALTKGYANTVIYFADDDNTYDIRLFNKYIRKVKKIGVWCCGFLAGHATRAPIVNEKNKVVGFTNGREMIHNFQIDMAMFAISIDAIMTHPHFEVGKTCDDNRNGPEKCMLRNFNFTMNDFEPFGKLSKKKGPMEVLVYHVRTKKPNVVGSAMIEDYDIEI